jgi:hypothetical protein
MEESRQSARMKAIRCFPRARCAHRRCAMTASAAGCSASITILDYHPAAEVAGLGLLRFTGNSPKSGTDGFHD